MGGRVCARQLLTRNSSIQAAAVPKRGKAYDFYVQLLFSRERRTVVGEKGGKSEKNRLFLFIILLLVFVCVKVLRNGLIGDSL